MPISPRFENSRILVSDLDASMTFYCDTLGLTPVGGFRVSGDVPFVEIFLADREGRRCLTLQVCAATPVPSGTAAYPPFVITVPTVEDLTEAQRVIREGGYELAVPLMSEGTTNVFMPIDPDGYLVEVIWQPAEEELPWGNRAGEYTVIQLEDSLPEGLLGHVLR